MFSSTTILAWARLWSDAGSASRRIWVLAPSRTRPIPFSEKGCVLRLLGILARKR
jgi:hypothetical protein